ncbi:MAG: PASTA domain-containing protein [Candidatus Acidiferrales bacterium]
MNRLRQRMEWFGRLALMIFVLASVAFLSAITAMRFAIQGREVQMPKLAGKNAKEALSALQSAGLSMKIDDRVYSDRPVDTVVRQSPPPDIKVKRGQRAHVVLSLGPQRVTIPLLTDKSIRAARIELLRGGMQVGELSSVYLAQYGSDYVVQQVPAPGTSDAISPHVDLLVSLGPRLPAYVTPNFTGMTLPEAQQKLGVAGLRISKVTPISVLGLAAGIIAAQSPAPGSRLDANTAIELQVAE